MTELAITHFGLTTWGTQTPWSEVHHIVLTNDPAIVVDGREIVPKTQTITFELVTGDFIEVTEGTPDRQPIVDQLPSCVELHVADLAEVLAAAHPTDVLLWSHETVT